MKNLTLQQLCMNINHEDAFAEATQWFLFRM